MSKVLITGGAGFIGSKIAENCVKHGLDVRVFDIVKKQIDGVEQFQTGSILDPYEISNAVRGCDYIVHAAAALGVRRTEARRLECLYINIQGTINVLEAAVKEGVKKILFTSSSEVYGDGDYSTYTEDTPLNPKSNYAITKLVGEEYLRAYQQNYGLDYTIVRFFSVYGAGQSKQFVAPLFVDAINHDTAPQIYGDGKQVRAFCYVDDAARGATLALLSKEANGQIFNIGNDKEPITIGELAEKAIKISGKPLKPVYVGFEKSDRTKEREIYRRIPCVKKAKEVFDFEASISVDEGLKRMIS